MPPVCGYLRGARLVGGRDQPAHRRDRKTIRKYVAGEDVTVACMTISRGRGGKVVEEWELSDALGALQLIGAVPEMAQNEADRASGAHRA